MIISAVSAQIVSTLLMTLSGNIDPAVLHVLKQVKNPEIIRTLNCESGLQQYDEKGHLLPGTLDELGIAQFRPSTWKWMNEVRGTTLEIDNALAQINMVEWAFRHGLQHLWVCYNNLYG